MANCVLYGLASWHVHEKTEWLRQRQDRTLEFRPLGRPSSEATIQHQRMTVMSLGSQTSLDNTSMNLPDEPAPVASLSVGAGVNANETSRLSRLSRWSILSIGSAQGQRPKTHSLLSTASSTASQTNYYTSSSWWVFRTRYYRRIASFISAYTLAWLLPSLIMVAVGWTSFSPINLPAAMPSTWQIKYRSDQFGWYIVLIGLTAGRGLIDFLCYYFIAISNTVRKQRSSSVGGAQGSS